MSPYTLTELIRFIEATGESSNIDAKGPMTWDNGEAAAGLTKDILAFANSRDGGVMVIGKDELSSGRFVLTGLTASQADSFETTKVATWVNNHCAPPVTLVCHRVQHHGKHFVVVTVAEFDDVPHLCTKSFQDPNNSKKHLLREGVIYVRNTNAESAPLHSVDELRALVGLATRKRGQEMLVTFEAMLKGKPIVAPPSDEEQFEKELHGIEGELGQAYKQALEEGAWQLMIHPSSYVVERWPDLEHLEDVIRRRSVRLQSEFPRLNPKTHMREWGLCDETYRGWWTLARSGQFLHVRPYWENKTPFKSPWQNSPSEPDIAPGGWIEFKRAIYTISELFVFAVRLVEEYGSGGDVSFVLRATSLSDRQLVTSDHPHGLFPIEVCKARIFEFKKVMPVEEFRAEWRDLCAGAMKRYTDLFPGSTADVKVFYEWIKRFEERNY